MRSALWNNPFVHCEYVLLSLVNRADWPMTRQEFWHRENAGKKGGVSGVSRRSHEMQSKQDGRYIDEVTEPWGSTQMNRNGLI